MTVVINTFVLTLGTIRENHKENVIFASVNSNETMATKM